MERQIARLLLDYDAPSGLAFRLRKPTQRKYHHSSREQRSEEERLVGRDAGRGIALMLKDVDLEAIKANQEGDDCQRRPIEHIQPMPHNGCPRPCHSHRLNKERIHPR